MSLQLLRALSIAALAVAVPIARAANAEIVYYEVFGNSPDEIRRELNANGPFSDRGIKADGLTHWNVSWKFRYAPKGNNCEFTEFSSKLEGTITLPHWAASATASPVLITDWRRYIAALRLHEDGHYAHGSSAAAEIDLLGQSFRVSGNCSSITRTFNEQANGIIAKYQSADQDYDRETKLGQTQGAVFPRESHLRNDVEDAGRHL
jgi:predicted secreted Zn-dependent protease